MQSIISIKELEPSNEVTPRTYTWLDTKYVKVPSTIGKSKKEVSSLLNGFKIEYSGNGDTVIYQEPKGDTYIKEGSVVKIMLN